MPPIPVALPAPQPPTDRQLSSRAGAVPRRGARSPSSALALGLPCWHAHSMRRALDRRLDEASGSAEVGWSLSLPVTTSSSLLASWQSVGGCGAGAASGGGVGVKWIGHSVSGGLFNVQS